MILVSYQGGPGMLLSFQLRLSVAVLLPEEASLEDAYP